MSSLKSLTIYLIFSLLVSCYALLPLQGWSATLQGIRSHEAPDSTRVVLDTSAATRYTYFILQKPNRLVIDLRGIDPAAGFSPNDAIVGKQRVESVRGAARKGFYRLVIETQRPIHPKHFTLQPVASYGHRIVFDLFDKTPQKVAKTQPSRDSKKKPEERKRRNRNVVIAVDAGHGGEDPGASGPKQTREKTVVLQIAAKTAAAINNMRGFEAVLIRKGDYYLAHRKRTQLARESRADLFVSIHADAFDNRSVAGASVYTLSDRGASSETAKWLAERANQSDLLGGVGDVSLDDKDPVLAHVLLDLSMDGNRSQSIQVGESVLNRLGGVTKLHKRSVEQAAFLVLKSPDMPSILVETGFISNPHEERRLKQASYQDKVAIAIAEGAADYLRANPPPQTILADNRQEIRYTISRGDTLSEIASKFGVSATALKRRNKLRNDRIKIGQVLFIPRDA